MHSLLELRNIDIYKGQYIVFTLIAYLPVSKQKIFLTVFKKGNMHTIVTFRNIFKFPGNPYICAIIMKFKDDLNNS